MLTYDDALLILSHVAEMSESTELTPDSKIDPVRAGGEEYDCRLAVTVAGKTFSAFERVLEPFYDPLAGLSQACFEGACDCEGACSEDDMDQCEIAIEWMIDDILNRIVNDAASSNHRDMVYLALLNTARDRAARLSEIPAHLTEKDLMSCST